MKHSKMESASADPPPGKSAPPSLADRLAQNPPPEALPPGWVMRRSRHNPTACYFYNQDSGICRWDPPRALLATTTTASAASFDQGVPTAKPAGNSSRSILKRSAPSGGTDPTKKAAALQSDARTSKTSPPQKKRRSESSRTPEKVRVLHILKKHRGSRRPASWRNPKITDSKEKAVEDLNELIAILKESEGDAKELRATFEELAKTESDCSSAKRGGDLGYFGRKKMQPAFEKASFALKVGELSGIVDTSSGVHVILRLG